MRTKLLTIAISTALLAMTGPALASGRASGSLSDTAQPAEATVNRTTATGQSNGGAAGREVPKKSKALPRQLQTVQVVGIRASELNAIQTKRLAPNIEDNISAENIGELPDISIADSLQRITGVQVNRTAGEGSTVNVRGLPEVSTLINGAPFITPDNIDSIQPNYESMPSSLFSGADVYKSPTATMLDTGISGTINLHTYRPWDFKNGWTAAGTAEADYGSEVKNVEPNLNALFSYNARGHWGILLSLSHSDLTRNDSSNGFQEFAGRIQGENSSAANEPGDGYLSGWSGHTVPPQVVVLPGGGVDVNGDGKSTGAFWVPETFQPFAQTQENKRNGATASFQAALGDSFTLTVDGFYDHQRQYTAGQGSWVQPVNWMAATILPATSRDTGAALTSEYNAPGLQQGDWHQNFYTTQAYNDWFGMWESFAQMLATDSYARNFSTKLDFDNGGSLTGSLRFISGSASQTQMQNSVEFSLANGTQWPNSLAPGVSLPPGVYLYPSSAGGTRPFNANGLPPYGYPVGIDMSGSSASLTLPTRVAQELSNPNAYALKTISSQNDYQAHSGMNIIRLSGKYAPTSSFSLDFGLEHSVRSAQEDSFGLMAPVYAGNGASDPKGCDTLFFAADVVMNGGGVPGACTAGNSDGYFRAGMISANPVSNLPSIFGSNWQELVDPGQVQGLTQWAFNPNAMQNVVAFDNALYPGITRDPEPGATWNVSLRESKGYAQANFGGDLAGLPFTGNFGLRVIRTDLGVTQHLTGATQPYGLYQLDAGEVYTNRTYTDWLPAINFALDVTSELKVRLAASKNMMPLSLSQWGGGLTLFYGAQTLANGKLIDAVLGGNSNGNPDLNPWRSTNYDVSAEYYFGHGGLVSLDLFDIEVASFVTETGVQNCGLPDEDGIVRGRCVVINEPAQGQGQQLKGAEAGYRQAFSGAPGLLSHTGITVNGTFSPSNTGAKDLAGNDVPFPQNSKYSGNIVLWYQDDHWQLRTALNYRSKEAIESNYGGVNGMELYEAPTRYVDASVTYSLNKHFQLYLQGQNLNNEKERQYLVWPDQVNTNQFSERFFMLGVRGRM
ncbi:MAG TPA: TonB-dependent receptor [Rhodanobacteraceae bacterium]|nr:TonB-dependent receptor [Rhodanobacteraceae bacterium]